jgi:hypothetical protein
MIYFLSNTYNVGTRGRRGRDSMVGGFKTTTVGKPGVQKTLLICLINIHNFRNSDCFLVDRSSQNLTTLCLFI